MVLNMSLLNKLLYHNNFDIKCILGREFFFINIDPFCLAYLRLYINYLKFN